MNVLDRFGDRGIILASFSRDLEIFRYTHQPDHLSRPVAQRQFVGQAPPAATGRIEMQFQLVENGVALTQDLFVLRPITFAEGRRKNFIGAASDQFAFLPPAAALHERPVHDHVSAAIVLDEEDHVREAIEQRFAGERFGQLR